MYTYTKTIYSNKCIHNTMAEKKVTKKTDAGIKLLDKVLLEDIKNASDKDLFFLAELLIKVLKNRIKEE